MENQENQEVQKNNWSFFEDEGVSDKAIEKVEEKDEAIESKEEIKEESKQDLKQEEYETLKQKLETLNKQQKDTQNWGRKQRAGYVVAKKRVEELAQKMFDDGTIYEEQLEELKNVFNHSFETGDIKEMEAESNPFNKVVNELSNTLEEYKKWNTDKDADLKFQSFFKHLDLVTPKKLKDIQEYLLTEDPKEALKYILDNGDKYYNTIYKPSIDKGDTFTYIKELTKKNEELEKKVKELTKELELDNDKVYSKSIKSRGAASSANNCQNNRWGESGNFFDN